MPRKRQAQVKTEDETATGGDTAIDPSSMTLPALKAELGKRGLATSGKKPQLVKRLQEALSDTPTPSKKVKEESEEDTDAAKSSFSKAAAALRKTDEKKRKPKVDSRIPAASFYEVVDDWDCMLNQTNIGYNNNKYYVIQLLKRGGGFYVWNRWGRVGEPGQSAMKAFGSLEKASAEFCKKFKDKTRNNWEDRENFKPSPGKYTLIDMGDDEDDGVEEMIVEETDAPPVKVKSCTLDQPTQKLIKLIFDKDMFQSAMKKMDIDTKKMPLGKLSKVQIAKGFEALEQLEEALKRGASRTVLMDLSSKFYTIVPHDFGRLIPPVIDNAEHLQKKFDMLTVLGDIEIAQSLQKSTDKKPAVVQEVPHPLDVNYGLLNAKLKLLKTEEDEFKVIEKYTKETRGQFYRKPEIIDVWKVDRGPEGERFKAHDEIHNRRLLWHGTNVAVVTAILKGGLRIMPHSGGRVGKGIYFASENSKSAGYVGCAGNIGIMFLNEVALGKEFSLFQDNSSLRSAPGGYESVVARGHTEPDPKFDTKIFLDGKEVVVPQGQPIRNPAVPQSSFSQSEYLVYKESQVRIRYLLKMKFS